MTPPPSDPLIGHTLDGRYAIHSRIARGGMAMVYRAVDTRLHRQVALKVMHNHLAEDPDFRKRFEQEARNAAGLNHSNLVNIFDQGEESGYVYLVMEFLPSITLRQLLKQQHSLTAEQALEISEAVLSGLAAAHSAGIIHRDLKPENVLLADDGRIKLGDFGLARAASAHTTTGQALLGTIAYLSPELVTRGVADARSDLYAFGIMLFEMITGKQPFVGEQPMQIAYQHAHDTVPAPSSLTAEADPAIDELVRWSTMKDPNDRPMHAGQLLATLHDLTSETQGASLAETRVLGADALGTFPTPSTTVLHGAIPPPSPPADPLPDEIAGDDSPHSTVQSETSDVVRAQRGSKRRKRKGWLLFWVTIVLTLVAGGLGWWHGQGPGSQITIPDVLGQQASSAEATLDALDLRTSLSECSHLSVPEGHVTQTSPRVGTPVDRETLITLCVSTGPEQLPVPPLVGLPLEEAKEAIESAGFFFGTVLEERFDGGEADAVIAALDDEGQGLGETYSEQAEIDLIVSAGSIPDVSTLSLEEATETLEGAGLSVDSSQNTENHHSEVADQRVISLNFSNDPLRVGDSVGLNISIGPELFAIPDVADLRSIKEAISVIQGAGFVPTTVVPEAFQGAIRPASTTPAAGERVPHGTEVTIHPRFID